MTPDEFIEIAESVKQDTLLVYSNTNNYCDRLIRIGILNAIDNIKSKMVSVLANSEAENV